MSAEDLRSPQSEPAESPQEPGSSAALEPSLAQAVVRSLPASIVVLDPAGTVLWASGQGAPGLKDGWPSACVRVGASYLSDCLLPAARNDESALRTLSGVLDVLHGRAPEIRLERQIPHPDGARHLLTTVRPLAGTAGALLTEEDMTGRAGFPDSPPAPAYCRACDKGLEAIAVADAARRILMVNDAFSEVTGFSRAEVVGCELGAPRAEDLDADLYATLWQRVETHGNWQGRVLSRRKNGEPYTALIRIDAVRDEDGLVRSYVSSASDMTALAAEEGRLHWLAHHDALTGLANRLLFRARLEQAIEHAGRSRARVAVLFIDMDRFKSVNDTLGHAAGDQVLKATAERLRAQVRAEDTVARLGGDEIGVILEGVGDSENAVAVARKLGAAVSQPLEIQGHGLSICASIGVGMYPEDGRTPDDLLDAADAAMFQAKRGGLGVHGPTDRPAAGSGAGDPDPSGSFRANGKGRRRPTGAFQSEHGERMAG